MFPIVKGVKAAVLAPAMVPLLSQPTPTKLLQFVPCHSVMAGAASAGLTGLMTMVAFVPDATKLYQTSSAGDG